MPKIYDRAYFDKWYRHPDHAVASPAELRRKVAMVVAQAEYYLGRPIRNVLDVGCGEATWRAPLRALRPDIAYRGLDASEYVVARYGRRRNIGLARFGQLDFAGSAWEWTLDLYDRYPKVCDDCAQLQSGLERVLRGGGFLDGPEQLRTDYRHHADPQLSLGQIGFRCAYDM